MNSLHLFVPTVPWENMTHAVLPPDLKVIEELVSPEEERQLLDSIDWTEDEDLSKGELFI